tara:strand:- start:958 stop:1887 length:930 start_codon:yes stop_codon:yes gene_type:complete
MARRSTKLLRFENTLYRYKRDDQTWTIDSVNDNISKKQVDLFDKGTQATCKHMSQKVDPNLFRLGFTKEWSSTPFVSYAEKTSIDNKLFFQLFCQDYIKSSFKNLSVFLNKVEFKEVQNTFYINIYYYVPDRITKKDTAIVDRKKKRYAQQFTDLSQKTTIDYIPFFDESSSKDRNLTFKSSEFGAYLEQLFTKLYPKTVKINFHQHKTLGESASLISNFLSSELENSNANFKRALRNTLRELKNTSSIRGIRINCSGRLGKAPMAKTEWFKYGQIPLSKMNSNLDFAKSVSQTKYGTIGTKVWIYFYS